MRAAIDASLTPLQRQTLKTLARLLATAREASISANAPRRTLSVMALGELRDKGLVESRVVRRSGRQWTEYWLTPEGAEEVKR